MFPQFPLQGKEPALRFGFNLLFAVTEHDLEQYFGFIVSEPHSKQRIRIVIKRIYHK